MPPPRTPLKIRPSKGESDRVFSSFSVENNGISVHQNSFTFPLNQDRLQYALSSYHACMIIFSFVTTKHLDIASYIP